MQTNLKQQLKTLLKSSCLLLCLFLVGCSNATPFEKTFDEVAQLDARNNINVSDYQQGITYFDTFAREDVTINDAELVELISELEAYKTGIKDEEAIAYVDFRISLFNAERYYKQAARKPFAAWDGMIRCQQRGQEILESIETVREATAYLNDAILLYNQNNWEFMEGNWGRTAQDDIDYIRSKAKAQESVILNQCSNFANATAVNQSQSE